MNEYEIVKLVKKRPEEGLCAVIDEYGGAVRTICRCMLSDLSAQDAEEAESDVYIRVWKNIGSLRSYESLRAYICTIARNTCRDVLRKKRIKTVEIEENMHPVYVDDSVEDREISEILHEIIYEMGEPESSVFICRYFMMMKVADIAELTGLDRKKTENILARGKKKLKAKLAERGIESYEEC